MKEDFQEEIETDPVNEEDKKILEEIVEKIKNSMDGDGNTAKIEINEGCDIKIVTPDVISLETPQTRLHKSFSQLKFKKIEDYDQGKKIYFKE